jgi:hypothetical protein
MRALRRGEDIEDRDGNPITWEEAQVLGREGRLKVAFGRLNPRGAGLG